MGFSDFDLRTAIQTFALTEIRDADLFVGVEPIEPSELLRTWLDTFAPVALGVNSEKARSEFIITPMLAETKLRVGNSVNVLPGVTFDVDKARGLSGYCDFLIARSPEIFYIQGPIIAVVEAKKEDLIAGLGQCVAEMVAIRVFNERESTPVPAIFGGVPGLLQSVQLPCLFRQIAPVCDEKRRKVTESRHSGHVQWSWDTTQFSAASPAGATGDF